MKKISNKIKYLLNKPLSRKEGMWVMITITLSLVALSILLGVILRTI